MSIDDNKESKATIKLLVETEAADDSAVYNAAEHNTAEHNTAKDNANVVVKRAEQSTAAKDENRIAILDRLVAANMLVPGSALGPEFQDQYRRIKRPLLSNAFGKTASLVEHGNLIMVTSAVPGEGKTFTSVNLALSIAQEKDKTVLLMDCDVAKQGVSRMLAIDKTYGLVDILESGDITIADAMLQTDIPKLRIVPAGRQDEYVTELLASQSMTGFVNELVNRYDDRIIIIDAPPLLSTPQTQILAGLVGQVVFVIEAGKTSQSLVEDALELIPEGTATGIVMNKKDGLFIRAGDYYGYYGYEGMEDGSTR